MRLERPILEWTKNESAGFNPCLHVPFLFGPLMPKYNRARESQRAMKPSLEQTLVDVWRQVLVKNATAVELGGKRYSVRTTPRKGLRQVDFTLNGNEMRALEQNPDTKSRWAQMARSGKKVMQFLSEGRYVANVVDGKVTLYGR
jgi:hypothetical protein